MPQLTPEEQAEQNKLLERYIELLQRVNGLSTQQARIQAEGVRNANNLNKEVERLEEYVRDVVSSADYLFKSFRETTGELKNQNVLLNAGKSTFKNLTSIAEDLKFAHQGITDLTEKDLKKKTESAAKSKDQLINITKQLGTSEGIFKNERELNNLRNLALTSDTGLTRSQKSRLETLNKEKELYEASKNALEEGIPLLEKELNLAKLTVKTRENLGGITQAAGKTLSQFGGSLASFLNIGEATEAVNEYNKNLIQGALNTKEVQDELLKRERAKIAFQKQLERGRITEAEYNRQIARLEKEQEGIKQKAIASTDNLANKFKSLGVFAKELGTGLKKSLTDPATILTFIVGRAFAFNKVSVDIGKNLGTGTKESDKIAQNLASIANYSTNLNVTFKNAAEAMSELNSVTGGVANYSADALETQIMLTKQFGLTGEEAAGIYKASVLTGKSSKVVNEEMVAAFVNTRNMVGGSANFKATIAEAAKVSGQLAANFKNNPAEITKAVVQAQALGTTLEKAKDQGKELLNFESSIEDELKAELLTGQQMNLERARAAALQGDQVTVMKELANQGMTLEKFQNMNVLAQQSFAKALGLSADELANQLNKQKIAQEQGKSLAELTKEEALEAQKRQTIQDKFNTAIEKLQDLIGNLVGGPFAILLDMLSEALKLIGYIVQPFQWIYDFTKKIGDTIGGWLNALGVVGKVLKVIAGVAIILAAYSAAASVASIPIAGWVLAPIVAAGILGLGFGLLNSKSAGDMISPADGRTQVSTKEGELFKLSKNDDVLAGPGLAKAFKGGDNKGETISPSKGEAKSLSKGETISPSKGEAKSLSKGETISPTIDLTPMIAAIKEVKASIDKLYNKNTAINMDGKKVGTTLTQGSYKVA
jgi:hypothetical protein